MPPFPDDAMNAFVATDPKKHHLVQHLVSAQAMVFDPKERL